MQGSVPRPNPSPLKNFEPQIPNLEPQTLHPTPQTHTHTHTHTHTSTHTHTHTHTHSLTQTHTYKQTNTHTHTHTHTHKHTHRGPDGDIHQRSRVVGLGDVRRLDPIFQRREARVCAHTLLVCKHCRSALDPQEYTRERERARERACVCLHTRTRTHARTHTHTFVKEPSTLNPTH